MQLQRRNFIAIFRFASLFMYSPIALPVRTYPNQLMESKSCNHMINVVRLYFIARFGNWTIRKHVFEQLVLRLAKWFDIAVYLSSPDNCVWSLHRPTFSPNSNFLFSHSTKNRRRALQVCICRKRWRKNRWKGASRSFLAKVCSLRHQRKSPCRLRSLYALRLFSAARVRTKLLIEFDSSQRLLAQSLLSEEGFDRAENPPLGKNSQTIDKEEIVLSESRQFWSEPSSEGNRNTDDEAFAEPPRSPPFFQNQAEIRKSTSATIFISKLLPSQREIISKRKSLTLSQISKKNLRKFKSLILHTAANAVTIEGKWNLYLETVDKRFFTNAQARMTETSRVRKREVAYQGLLVHLHVFTILSLTKGLLVNEKNCEDMKMMHRLRRKTKEDMGQNIGTYDEFQICIGQFCRFAVSAGLCTAEEICNKGCAFTAVSSMDACGFFLLNFQICGESGTVAGHLICLARYAES